MCYWKDYSPERITKRKEPFLQLPNGPDIFYEAHRMNWSKFRDIMDHGCDQEKQSDKGAPKAQV